MTSDADTRALLDVERRFWNAMRDKDANVAASMTDDVCITVGAQGVSAVTPDSMGTMTTEGKWQLQRFAFSDDKAQVRLLSDDVALVAYPVHLEVTMDGKPLSMDANEASVWVRRDGTWRCALHTESVVGDPFQHREH
ncbi:MAG: nuclear transport factor 2 family protein [Gemmatimonadota bacterium]